MSQIIAVTTSFLDNSNEQCTRNSVQSYRYSQRCVIEDVYTLLEKNTPMYWHSMCTHIACQQCEYRLNVGNFFRNYIYKFISDKQVHMYT